MKIFSFLNHSRRFPEWSYTSTGRIWRLLFSDTGRIIGESRNPDLKQASFFCVDEKTGQNLWENLTMQEPWWVGMESVQKDVLLLHEFAKPDLPEHKVIKAYDVESARLLWHNQEMTYWFGYQNSVYAYKTLFERRIGYSLDLRSGEVAKEYDDTFEGLEQVRSLAQSEDRLEDYRFPQIFGPHTADPRSTAVIERVTKRDRIMGDVEFVREKEYLLFNYHVPEKTSRPEAVSLENHLEIVEVEKNEKVFSELLTRGAKSPVPDSFFVKGDFVYYVKDEHTLSALRLWKS